MESRRYSLHLGTCLRYSIIKTEGGTESVCSGKPCAHPPQASAPGCAPAGQSQPPLDTHGGQENTRTCRVSNDQNRLVLFEWIKIPFLLAPLCQPPCREGYQPLHWEHQRYAACDQEEAPGPQVQGSGSGVDVTAYEAHGL